MPELAPGHARGIADLRTNLSQVGSHAKPLWPAGMVWLRVGAAQAQRSLNCGMSNGPGGRERRSACHLHMYLPEIRNRVDVDTLDAFVAALEAIPAYQAKIAEARSAGFASSARPCSSRTL